MSAVLDYLKARGFEKAEALVKAEIKAMAAGKSSEGAAAGTAGTPNPSESTISVAELAAKSAPRDPTQSQQSPQPSLEVLAAEALLIDKTDRIRGFGMVRNWCQGGLDVYQAELRPLLLPLFVHAYLDLIEMGAESAAYSLYAVHSSSLLPQHTSLLSHLRSVSLPAHMASDDLVARFRSERYVLKMSQTVFGLLLGWLTDGTGPLALAGAADGVGGEGAEAPAMRGRLAMLRIINERCRIQVLQAKPYELTPALLQEGTGLTGAGPSHSSHGRKSRAYPALLHSAVADDGSDAVQDYNARNAGPQLKLGPQFPLNDRLKEEVQREVEGELREEEQQQREQAAKEAAASGGSDGDAPAKTEDGGPDADAEGDSKPPVDAAAGDQPMDGVEQEGDAGDGDRAGTPSTRAGAAAATAAGGGTATPAPSSSRAAGTASVAPFTGTTNTADHTAPSSLLQPTLSDLPPQPPLFRTVDVMREVARVRDARKALRIDLHSSPSSSSSTRSAALPSICAYTYHDVEDGLTCSTFSDDLSLMAGGFEESYVQLWSLKGEALRPLRGDVSLSDVRDGASLAKQRRIDDDEGATAAPPTRKLIGHSGPVYSLSFDPLGGSASSPRTLLSASADSTVRLWSMDTYSALVAYRGHSGPVWDVSYGPSGLYFATCGMDKTARLWNTERINPLRMYAGHLSDVDCLAFHPNSLYLATGSSDRTARLWDVQRGACVRLFVGHSAALNATKISPDGRYLATAEDAAHATSPTISLWDLGSGRRIKKMWGHTRRIDALDFSTDGALLVSSSSDCTVRSWDVRGAGGQRKKAGAGAGDITTHAGAATTDPHSSADCISTLRTRKTPMLDVKMTRRNLCVVAGAYDEIWEP